ncbi:MAG: hypothetical protein ACP5EP_08850 [Acidobacteriaceae bacterium]
MKYLRLSCVCPSFLLFLFYCMVAPLVGQTQKRWGPLTSGPFFTGTAEADPPKSGYYEPWVFDTLTSSLGQSQYSMPQRISYGIWNNLEVDSYVPLNYNKVGPPSTSSGQTVTAYGTGNYHIELKRQLTSDADTHRFWARPALAITYQQWIPTGKYRNLNPALYGADQMGSGTYNEGLNLLARKRFKPFEGYFQFGNIIEDPTHVGGGYTYNNGYSTVPNGEVLRVVNGDLLYYAGALEHVLNSKHGFGYLIEYNGEAQNKRNLIFGHANAPSWNFLHISPEAEYTWPNKKGFAMTWGGGIALPAEQSGYARSKVPMFTVTFYRNGPQGYRGE